MSCLTSTQKADLRAQITTLEARLVALNAAYLAGAEEIRMYSLDTNEAKQTVNYRSLDELQTAIDATESRLDRLRRKLNGIGLVNMRLRRAEG